MRRSCHAILASLFVLGGSSRQAAQVRVPPSASLDVHITAAPMPREQTVLRF